MSRGTFTSIDSGPGFPANGLTVILLYRSELSRAFSWSGSFRCKKEAHPSSGALQLMRRLLLPGIDCLVSHQEGSYQSTMFDAGDPRRRSIGGRTTLRT